MNWTLEEKQEAFSDIAWTYFPLLPNFIIHILFNSWDSFFNSGVTFMALAILFGITSERSKKFPRKQLFMFSLSWFLFLFYLLLAVTSDYQEQQSGILFNLMVSWIVIGTLIIAPAFRILPFITFSLTNIFRNLLRNTMHD